MIRIDSHVHIWNVDEVQYAWPTPSDGDLYRNIEPPELKPHLDAAGIQQAILIQAADHEQETEYLLRQAEEHDWIAGVVGWVPLERPIDAAKQLERLTSRPKFKGVRHLIHCEEDPDWLVRANVIDGLKLLSQHKVPFDVVAVFPNHLKHVPTVAERVPELKLVLDHLAKPPIQGGFLSEWEKQLKQAAAYPNVYAKLSGLNTACDWSNWSADDWKPSLEAALEAFTPNRLMFGSDWPVANLAGNYARVAEATEQATAMLSGQERQAIWGGTAATFYQIDYLKKEEGRDG